MAEDYDKLFENLETSSEVQESNASSDYSSMFSQMEGRVRGDDDYLQDLQRDRTEAAEDLLRRIEDQRWDTEDTLLAARSFVDGMWLNKGDEISTWVSATAYKLFGMYGSEDKSISEIRGEMLERAERQAAEFREERPITAVVTNIAGGIASPASVYGGQLLQTGRAVRAGEQARRTAPAILGGADEASVAASRAMAQQASGVSAPLYSAMARTAVPVQGAAVAAAEGAVFGFEGANLNEKLENAAFTGVLSAAFPLGFGFMGSSYNALTKNRVAQELGSGDNFVNLMLTETTTGGKGLSDVYRHLVGKAFGANTLMEGQVNNIISRIPKSIEALKQKSDTLTTAAKNKLAYVKEMSTKDMNKSVAAAKSLASDLREEATMKNTISKQNIDDAARRKIDDLEDVSGKVQEDIKAVGILEADAAVNALNADFRANALLSALPAEAGKTAQEITTLKPQEALSFLDDIWKKVGFNSAKKADYVVDPNKITSSVQKFIKNDAETLALMSSENRANSLVTFVQDSLARNVKNGRIKGKDMVGLRSDIGSFLNNLADGQLKRLTDDIQGYLDNIIVGQLDDKAAAAFNKDKALWRNNRMVNKATETATGGTRLEQGAFNAADWIDAAKSTQKGLAARGKVVLQKEAQEVSALSRQRDQMIKDHAGERAIKEAKKYADDIETAKLEQRAAKTEAAKAYRAEQRAIREEFERSSRTAIDKQTRAVKEQRLRSQHTANVKNYDERIKTLTQAERQIRDLTSSGGSRITIFEQMFASGVLGQLIGRALGKSLDTATSLLVGTAGGYAMRNQPVQRFLAGQSVVQEVGRGLGQTAASVGAAGRRVADYETLFPTVFGGLLNQDVQR